MRILTADGAGPRMLPEVNQAITAWLLQTSLGFSPPTIRVSELAARGLLREPLQRLLANLDDVITVFNATVDALMAADVDPQVRPLPDDYLPVWYACPRDGKRCRLRRKRDGVDQFAVATCSRCGNDYRFHLGAGVSSFDEIDATGRWSPDVTLPIHVNDLVSGVVAGRSTALYGLVLGEVTRSVLGGVTVPVLVPHELGQGPPGAVDSLFHHCMVGTT
jgi:nucleotide-binding universal stress UspA family protein